MQRIIAVTMAIAALTFVGADAANATCVQSGEIVRVTTLPGAGATTIWLTNSSLGTVFWTATTTDDKMLQMSLAAGLTRERVQITGNAIACPAAGTSRPMGVITAFTLHP